MYATRNALRFPYSLGVNWTNFTRLLTRKKSKLNKIVVYFVIQKMNPSYNR